ncbi:MAG TPA: hypothetical protein VIR63_06575 [Pontiella sp.]
MRKQYLITMFVLCFGVWAVVVDNAFLPSMKELKQDVGEYSRYRVKKWTKGKKIDLLQDEILVYAYVDNREKLYYMEYTPHFEATLKVFEERDPIQLRYAKRFPKVWKKHLYDLRQNGVSMLCYSPAQLMQKQKFINKFSAIVGGIFIFLAVISLINKPRKK